MAECSSPYRGLSDWAIVVPPILAEHFELKHSLINMMTSNQFFGLEKDNPHDHIRWFNKITSTIKYKDVPNSAIKLMLFPFSLAGAARRWLEKEPPRLGQSTRIYRHASRISHRADTWSLHLVARSAPYVLLREIKELVAEH
ncbi:hypothetical protein Tco_0409063 [Tanacetum coccineum]